MHAMAPNNGPRCADAVGRSLDIVEDVERRRMANPFNAWTAAVDAPGGRAALNERSQIERRARP
jgi:hypothetical protein